MGKKWQLRRVWKCHHYFSTNLPVTSHQIWFLSLSLYLFLYLFLSLYLFLYLSLSLSLSLSLLWVSLASLSSCIFIFFVVEWKVHIDGMALTVILLFFVDTYYIYQTHPFNHTNKNNKNNNNESFPIPISDPDKYSLPRIIITYQPSYSNRGSNLSFILIMKHGSLLSLVQYLYSICTR